MNQAEALAFLRQHQPLPDDDALTAAVINQFDAVLKFFVAAPCDKAVPLLLRVFGRGDGWGVYPMVEFALLSQDRARVVAEIGRILQDEHTADGVRYWVTQAAMAFADASLVAGLMVSLRSADGDICECARAALALC